MRPLAWLALTLSCLALPSAVRAQAARRLTSPSSVRSAPATRSIPELPTRIDTRAHNGQEPASPPLDAFPELRFTSNEPGLAIMGVAGVEYRLSGYAPAPGIVRVGVREVPRWAVLCRTPCVARLPLGFHRLAARRGRSGMHETGTLTLQRPTTVNVRWSDQSDMRLAGIITVIGAIVTAASLTLGGFAVGGTWSGERVATMIAGAPVFVLGLLIGIPLAATSDGASMRIAGRAD